MSFFPAFMNSAVQPGTKVLIKGLTSEKGQAMNSHTGTVKAFQPGSESRWSVELDNQDGNGEKRVVSINIRNLECIFDKKRTFNMSVMVRDNPSWNDMSKDGIIPMWVGQTSDGTPTLMVVEDKEGGFDPAKRLAVGPSMGLGDHELALVGQFCQQINENRR